MYAKFLIFVISLLLLVPLAYSSFSTNEACAAPRDPKWGGNNSTCKKYAGYSTQVCCWLNDDYTVSCQVCNKNPQSGEYTDCGDVFTPRGKLVPPSGVLPPDGGEPTIKPPTTEPKVPRGDTGLEPKLLAPSEQNSSTNNNTIAKDLGRLNENGK